MTRKRKKYSPDQKVIILKKQLAVIVNKDGASFGSGVKSTFDFYKYI